MKKNINFQKNMESELCHLAIKPDKLTKPLVSIVTPVFNGEKFIRRTIESVLNQTYKNVEYIIVDGASTDGTTQILEEYALKIDLIISENDSGMYEAINKGLFRSNGDILCYLNADDYFSPDAVQLVVNRFLTMDAELVFGDCIFVDESEHELRRYVAFNLPYFLIRRLGRLPFTQPSAFWSRRLFIEIGGFDLKYKYVADTKFLFECLSICQHKVSHVNEFISMFRVHENAFSTRLRKSMIREHNQVLEELNMVLSWDRFLIEIIIKLKNYRNYIRSFL